MPFIPGISGNPAGKPKGSSNKITPELRDALRSFVIEEGFPAMLELFRKEGTSVWFKFHFFKEILPYVEAKKNELKLDINKLTTEEIKILIEKIKTDENL